MGPETGFEEIYGHLLEAFWPRNFRHVRHPIPTLG
jgi:hypothetical protein